MNQLSGAVGALGDPPAMRHESQRAIAFASERGWGSSPRMAYAYTLAAWAAHLTLDLETADRHASTAVAVLGSTMTPEVEVAARSCEAVVAFDRLPDRRAALARIRRTWTTIDERPPSPALISYAQIAELRMCLALGERIWARQVADRIERMLPASGEAAVAHGLLLLNMQRGADARRAVRPVLEATLSTAVTSTAVTAWLVEATAATRAGEPTAAHAALCGALDRAAPGCLLRPFYDMGTPMRDLLVATSGRLGSLDTFVSDVLTAWSTAEQWQARHADTGDGAHRTTRRATGRATQPLTVRELDLLRDLPSMPTVEEIAEAHVVSSNTVKTHLKSIYRKLGVNSRREAVGAARATGLL